MSVTIQLDLPDALVKEAQDNGLLESKRLGELPSNGASPFSRSEAIR